jgi:hypothetical protein
MIDIDTMPAGREMDALIAERVMGWKWMGIDHETLAMLLDPTARRHPAWREYPDRPHSSDWDAYVPHYSTDIAAAWEVVEAMQSESRPDAEWIHFAAAIDGVNLLTETAGDAALAICRAALKAVSE